MSDIEDRVKKIVIEHLVLKSQKYKATQNLLMI